MAPRYARNHVNTRPCPAPASRRRTELSRTRTKRAEVPERRGLRPASLAARFVRVRLRSVQLRLALRCDQKSGIQPPGRAARHLSIRTRSGAGEPTDFGFVTRRDLRDAAILNKSHFFRSRETSHSGTESRFIGQN